MIPSKGDEPSVMAAAPVFDAETAADLSLSFSFLSAANRLTLLAARGVKEAADLTLTEWRVLTVLSIEPGTIASKVVRMVMVDKSVASRALRHLENGGLITIEADPNNRSQNRLWLTSGGEALYRRVLPRIRETEEQAWASLSAGERMILREIIAKLSNSWINEQVASDAPDRSPV